MGSKSRVLQEFLMWPKGISGLESAGTQVRSPGLRIRHCQSCGLGHNCGSDPWPGNSICPRVAKKGNKQTKPRILHRHLAHSTTKGVGRPPKPPLWPHPSLPSPFLRDQLTTPSKSEQGNLFLALNFSSGLLSISFG